MHALPWQSAHPLLSERVFRDFAIELELIIRIVVICLVFVKIDSPVLIHEEVEHLLFAQQ